MGITTLDVTIANPANSKLRKEVEFLVDSGAIYSVVEQKILSKLRIKPISEKKFFLANGQSITRKIGGALYEYGGEKGYASVVFGERGDSNLLGATTLESLGLILDPLKRRLLNLPMALGSLSGRTVDLHESSSD